MTVCPLTVLRYRLSIYMVWKLHVGFSFCLADSWRTKSRSRPSEIRLAPPPQLTAVPVCTLARGRHATPAPEPLSPVRDRVRDSSNALIPASRSLLSRANRSWWAFLRSTPSPRCSAVAACGIIAAQASLAGALRCAPMCHDSLFSVTLLVEGNPPPSTPPPLWTRPPSVQSSRSY